MKRFMKLTGRWAVNVLLAVDQLGSALLLEDPDETISSRLGKLKRSHGGRVPWKRPLSKGLDWLLEKVDPGHAIDAIEDDEGKRAVL